MRRTIYFILFFGLFSCNNLSKSKRIYSDLEKVCEELKLSNCNISFNVGTDNSPYDQEQLYVKCSLTDLTHEYYINNPSETSMRIALYLYKNNLQREGVFPFKVLKVGIERNDTVFSIEYQEEDLVTIFEADKVVNEFIDLVDQKRFDDAKLLTEEETIDDSIPTFVDIIRQAQECGGQIIRREFIGAYFSRAEATDEALLVYSTMIYRENDINLINCYVLNNNHKIVYLELGSDKKCE